MKNFLRTLPYYTYDDWIQWEGHWELIDGIAWAMSPLPGANHQRIASNLVAEFGLSLKNCNTCTSYMSIDYLVKDDTILQPDMLVVNGDITKEYLDFPPALVVEVLSPATVLKDRHAKYIIYESQGIKYYIIVAAGREEVEIYELIDGEYRLKRSGKNIVHDFFFPECSARVDFKKIW